jgi:hypothetical protein
MAVVFGPDTFTVGANANIDAYPATPDYAYSQGSGSDAQVLATGDHVQILDAAQTILVRLIDGSVSGLTDYELTANCRHSGDYQSGALAVRVASGAATGYLQYLELGQANEHRIIRVVAGAETVIASWDEGLAGAATYVHVMKVTGTGASVDLESRINAGTLRTFSDTNAARLTSGAPGLGGYADASGNALVDDYQVDDLGGGGTSATITGVTAAAPAAGIAGAVAAVQTRVVTGITGEAPASGIVGAVAAVRIVAITGVTASADAAGIAGAVAAQIAKVITGVTAEAPAAGIAGTVATVNIANVTGITAAAPAAGIAGTVSAGTGLARDQEGYRWRNDDGSETTATWIATQDTDITFPSNTVVRLRILTNVTGDAPSEPVRLQARKVGETDWWDVA